MILRDYQVEAVENIREAFRAGTKRVLFVLPTGGGKSMIFAYMAVNAVQRGKRVCILVHRRELLKQTSDLLNAFRCSHGIIQAGFTPSFYEPLQIASVQTLINRRHKYNFDFIITDECHHVTSQTYIRILNSYPKAFSLGVTATPLRLDGRGLGLMYDEMIEGPNARWLTDNGYLAKIKAFVPPGINTEGMKHQHGDFAKAAL